jgi:hypothetical protein
MSKNSNDHINAAMNERIAAIPVPSGPEVLSLLGVYNNTTVYTEADGFSGNPDGLLGSVMQVRRTTPASDTSPASPTLEFCPTKIPNTTVDANSHLKEPIKRQSIIVDQQLTAQVNFLNYLGTQIDQRSTFSLLVFDQATGQVDRNQTSWAAGISSWKAENQDLLNAMDVIRLFVIIGYVQKYIIRKKYNKLDVKAKGGGFGININGELYTSSEDYSLDIRYGLTVAPLKSPTVTQGLGMAPRPEENISRDDLLLLQNFSKINRPS